MGEKTRRIPSILPREREARQECYLKHKDSFDLNDDLLREAVEMTSVGRLILEGLSERTAFVLLGLYGKACKTFRAIQILCLFGLGEDANGLLRVLAETLVNMFYIDAEDKDLREKRAQKFADHGAIWKQKYLDIVEKHRSFGATLPQPERARLHEIIAEIHERYSEKEYEEMSGSHNWNNLSAEAMANQVGLQSLYDISMRSSSESLHVRDLFEHISYDEKKGFILRIVPGDKWLQGVLWISNTLFHGILERINQLFQLGHDEKLQDFRDRLETIQHAVAGPLPPGTPSI